LLEQLLEKDSGLKWLAETLGSINNILSQINQ